MAKDAEEFARGAYTQDLLSHGYRTYYFGAMIAAYRKLKYDKEMYFSAAILHDIGLTESRLTPLTQCCFAVSVPLVIVGAAVITGKIVAVGAVAKMIGDEAAGRALRASLTSRLEVGVRSPLGLARECLSLKRRHSCSKAPPGSLVAPSSREKRL